MLEMEQPIEQLKFKLSQSEENYKKVVEERDKVNLEYIKIKAQLDEAKNMNDRLIRILENLSKRD
jgi:hypothetical protein